MTITTLLLLNKIFKFQLVVTVTRHLTVYFVTTCRFTLKNYLHFQKFASIKY